MKSNELTINWYHTVVFAIWIFSIELQAQIPVLKVDLNIAGRQEGEVNEPGYTPWPVSDTAATKTIEGITFSFTNGTFKSDWYKYGVQSPHYARFANDGLSSESIELRISGLQVGTHKLVTYHNTVSNPATNTYSPVDIYINGELIIDNLIQTNRVLSNDSAANAYLQFMVENTDPVVIKFVSELPVKPFLINGFHLNTTNPDMLAKFEYPKDKDEHVSIDNDTLIISWQPPKNTLSQDIYFGTNKDEVLLADTASPLFSGNQTDTFFIQTGFYSMDKYFWRIDPIDTAGERTKGEVWYFRKRIAAFPGAEGYGRYAIGGRGGKVVYVTNLEDTGPGSFRYAVENEIGPRTILFAVSGLITLNSRLVIRDDYITVAGQTAPGKGVCFRWAPIGVTGDNLIVQNIRVRLGGGVTFDGMGLTGAENSIIDHCSISWTIDEAFSSREAKNITLQRTLISEALNKANHSNYGDQSEHGFAASIGGDIGSFHHNLLAHCNGRNWSLAGGLDGSGVYAGRLDLFNNVVYNWGYRSTDGGAHEVNFVNNFYKPGESTTQFYALNAENDDRTGTQRYYFVGNVMPGHFDEANQAAGKTTSGVPFAYSPWVNTPFFESDATIQSAKDAYKLVLSDVGCTQPVFDDHDIRIVNETLNKTYTYSGSRTGKAGFPDSEKDVGGWEKYPGFLRNANWDTDFDGLPNWWEKALGLDTLSAAGDFSESNADVDSNGYTNLEDYLQWMANPHYFTAQNENLEIDLSKYTRGFTNTPVYEVFNVVNGVAVLEENTSKVTFTAVDKDLAKFEFKVTDSEGSSMTQKVGIFVGETAPDSLFSYTYLLNRPVVVDPIGITENFKNESTLIIYPNPVNDFVDVTFQLEKPAEVSIELYNTLGSKVQQLVSRQTFNTGLHKMEYSMNHIAPGIYIIKIAIDNNQLNRLIVKN